MRHLTTELKMLSTIKEEYYTCDKCGERIKKDSMYDGFSCNLTYIVGYDYPEISDGEESSLDLCKNCAIVLMDLLKVNGYRINTEDRAI